MTQKEKEKIEKEHEKLIATNPIIDPVTTEELFEFSFKKNRDKYKKFPDKLPTFGKMPVPPDEHKHIGLYENKQTLYLYIAHAYNELTKKISLLEQRVVELENNNP